MFIIEANQFKLLKTILNINITRHYRKRVVVTGLGIVSSIGCNVLTAWNNILQGKSGITKLTDSEYEKFPCRVAGLVDDTKLPTVNEFNNPLITRSSKFVQYAAAEALTDSGLDLDDSQILKTTGVCIGSGYVEYNDVNLAYETYLEQGADTMHSLLISRNLMHVPCALISCKYKFQGPILSPSTGFTTGLVSVGQAFHYIRYSPRINIMICGATSSSMSPYQIAISCKINHLATKYNDTPEMACRPFDKERNGAVLSEGAAILVLESLEHALARHAHIYCEVKGFSMFAYSSSWKKLIKDTMRSSLIDANVHPDHVSYINANGCGSVHEDDAEAKAIQEFFGDRSWEMFVSSTKGSHGEMLGASGAIELIFTCLAIYYAKIPPTINFNSANTDYFLNFVPELDQVYYSKRKIVVKNGITLLGMSASMCLAYIRLNEFDLTDMDTYIPSI